MGISRIDQLSLPVLRSARDALVDQDVPVTLTRLSKKLGVPKSSLWHMLHSYAPWLKKDLQVVKGCRDDDGAKNQAFWGAVERIRKRHGIIAPFLLIEELNMKPSALKEFMRTNSRARRMKGCVSNWEARYRIAANTIPEKERTISTLAAALRLRFNMGTEIHVRAYLRRNPHMIEILKINGYQPRKT